MNEIRGNYKHLLFTRFNINSADTLSCRLDPAYLKVRFELFERYCLPSVQNQTNQNFIWLLLLDENTPNDYKDRIKLYQEKYGRITPIYLPTHLDDANEVYARISQEYALGVDFLFAGGRGAFGQRETGARAAGLCRLVWLVPAAV